MGCTACAKRRQSSNSSCNGKSQRLKQLRQKLVTLFNTTVSNNEKRAEYRAMMADVDTMIQNSKTTCPTQEDIVILTNYINNEYSNRN